MDAVRRPLHDFVVFGPSFVLTGAVWSSAPALELVVRRRGGAHVAVAHSVPRDSHIELDTQPSGAELSAADLVEIYRLFARVVLGVASYASPVQLTLDLRNHLQSAADLRADGFESDDNVEWSRPAIPFSRQGAKAVTMEQVYDDLYSVPWNFVGREWDVLDRLVAGGLPVDRDVLDLGCGMGKNASALEELGFRVFGLDASRRAIGLCRSVVRHPERFLAASAAALPWRAAAFGSVLDVGCFHCMSPQELDAGIAEAARVLRPGGVLYTRVFKPRSACWVEAQPVARQSFGMTADRLVAALGSHFECEHVDEHDHVTYVRARKRRA